jgi:Co/Zn/Cd efflux system component
MKLIKSIFEIPKMDCSAEEQMVKMKLADEGSVRQLIFDLPKRELTIYHHGSVKSIHSKISELGFGEKLLESSESTEQNLTAPPDERKLLWHVLLINLFCFVLEMSTGIIGKSMGLIADSLDMLADAFVYALSLYAVGKIAAKKKQIAKMSGYLQLGLAVLGFSEVIRRFLGFESLPVFELMVLISIVALIGNIASLLILQKSRSSEAHIKASLIFTSNDIIINLGVILAGVLVLYTESALPDLIVGSIVFVIVIRGAIRILKLAK